MKNFKLALSLACVLTLSLAVLSYLPRTVSAQSQGSQSLTTTTLSAAISSTSSTGVVLASASNVTATVSVQTTLYVDTEAMDVVTNSVNGTYMQVTRGTHGTKAELHASGATVYVGRPNLYQNYDVAGTCTASSGLAYVLPWINLSDGKRFECYSDGNWFNSGIGSQWTAAHATASSFCTGNLGSAETEYLNGAACGSATTATFGFVVPISGELANLRVSAGTAVTGGSSKDVLTVMKNGSATAITCTIAASGTSCSDLAHGVSVAAGDVITFRWVTATSDSGANIRASVGIYSL